MSSLLQLFFTYAFYALSYTNNFLFRQLPDWQLQIPSAGCGQNTHTHTHNHFAKYTCPEISITVYNILYEWQFSPLLKNDSVEHVNANYFLHQG